MQTTLRLLLCAALFLSALPAFGQFKRDEAANAKIDEALNEHYLVTDFQQAEGVLLGTIDACKEHCSPEVLARAWMYVGIVRGSGKQDQAGAKEAFGHAKRLDPSIALDDAIATPETQATFREAAGGTPPPAVAAQSEEVATDEGDVPVPEAGLACDPHDISLQTRRALPVSCQSSEEAALTLRYQEFRSEEWKSVAMNKVGRTYQATVPCEASVNAGPLKYYVIATDAAGDPLDTYGTKSSPTVIEVTPNVGGQAPSFPGQPAPERCPEEEICPPDFPGCNDGDKRSGRRHKDWGARCEYPTECKSGLLCTDGTCQTAPSCDIDSDCEDGGACIDGRCEIGMEVGRKAGFSRHRVGVHIGADIAFVSGRNVCQYNNPDFYCYTTDDKEYPANLGNREPAVYGDAYPGAHIDGTAVVSTFRILLSYDFAATKNVTLGVRTGYAFRGNPEDFVPFHGEGRIAYWFTGLGARFRPYVHVGGGFAEVDAGVAMPVQDCSEVGVSRDSSGEISSVDENEIVRCSEARGEYAPDTQTSEDLPRVDVVAYRKLGLGFVGAGGGAVYGVSDAIGVQFNLNAMYMLGAIGFVLEPSLGLTLSF